MKIRSTILGVIAGFSFIYVVVLAGCFPFPPNTPPKFPASSQSPYMSNEVSFYVSDCGIGMWDKSLKTGDDFSSSKCKYKGILSPDGTVLQILIVMPPDEELNSLTKEKIYNAIKDKIMAAIGPGVDKVEIQIIQNINIPGYMDPARQKKVAEFGKCAYEAIGMVIDELKSKGIKTKQYANLGSNGTTVFAKNANAWKVYNFDEVCMFTGRALIEDMIEMFKVIDPAKVSIFCTAGDYPAMWFFKRSIGNLEVVKELFKKYGDKGLKCCWLDPIDRLDIFGFGHNAGMNGTAKFLMKRLTEKGVFTESAVVTGSEIQAGKPKKEKKYDNTIVYKNKLVPRRKRSDYYPPPNYPPPPPPPWRPPPSPSLSEPPPPPPGGVSMEMFIDSNSIKVDTTDRLKKLREELLKQPLYPQ